MKFLFTLLLIVLSPSLYAEPIINVNQPIKKLKLTSSNLEYSIMSAATSGDWTIDSYGDGVIVATYKKSRYMAKIIIKYKPTFYSIHYLDSKRMRYRDSDIHPTYNKLIKALQKNIVSNLKNGYYPKQDSSTATSKTLKNKKYNDEHQSIQMKLVTLKKLYDDSLITQGEYETKRKKLIDNY